MAKYNLTNKAIEDLKRIWNYTFDKWSEEKADIYYKLLIKSCQDIADNPDLGKNYKTIKSELFGFKTNRHIIFYQKFPDTPIEVAPYTCKVCLN